MEEACHELDIAVAQGHGAGGGVSFTQYTSELQAISKLRDEIGMCRHSITILEQLSTLCILTLQPDDSNIQRVKDEIKSQKQKLQNLVLLNPHLNHRLP